MMIPLRMMFRYCAANQKLLRLSDITIPRDKIETKFSKSSGPGGQHVNKTNSKAEIRFKVASADWITDKVKENLAKCYANMINRDGELIVTSQIDRSQEQNMDDAIDKLRLIILECSQPDKKAFVVPPITENQQQVRIEKKRNKSEVKKIRSSKFDEA